MATAPIVHPYMQSASRLHAASETLRGRPAAVLPLAGPRRNPSPVSDVWTHVGTNVGAVCVRRGGRLVARHAPGGMVMRRLLTGTCLVVAFALGVALFAQPASLSAQTLKPEALVGKYEGSAAGPDGSPISLKVELRMEKGALVGAGESGQGP